MSEVPSDLRYTKTHEWVRVEGDIATIGVSDHAQHEMGDIIYVELPTVGKRVSKGEELAVIEAVKSSEPVYSPISGTVVEVNAELPDQASRVNDDPYGDGWMVRLKLEDKIELDTLMDASAYRSELGE